MSTSAKKQRSKVLSKAWELVKSMGLKFGEALKKAWGIVKSEAKKALANEALTLAYFQITFTKKDTGEVTTRIGSNAKLKDEDANLQFFSISDNGFRKAVIENILSVDAVSVDFAIKQI